MNNRKKTRKTADKSTTGVKTLLATGALLTTLGGWAILAKKDTTLLSSQESQPISTEELTLEFPPLPTLVPEGGFDPSSIPETPPEAPQAVKLRVVNSPRSSSAPASVTRTRSS